MNNIVLRLFNVNSDSINNDLLRKQKFIDELSLFLKRNGNNTYKSTIEKKGNKYILVTSDTMDGIGHYSFYIQNEAKTLTQAGRMEYPVADAGEAQVLLNEIINSIEFTK
ncbi:MAG: hypothetical protein V4456_03405 [Bacteroidota bacterium]